MLVNLYDCTEWAYNVEKCDWIFCFNVLSGFKKYTPHQSIFFVHKQISAKWPFVRLQSYTVNTRITSI